MITLKWGVGWDREGGGGRGQQGMLERTQLALIISTDDEIEIL